MGEIRATFRLVKYDFISMGLYSGTINGRNPAPVEVGSISHYLQGFVHPRWYKISSINRTFQGIITDYGNSYQPTAQKSCPRPSVKNHPGALGTACGSIHGGTCKSESLGKNTANALFSWLVHGPCDEQN